MVVVRGLSLGGARYTTSFTYFFMPNNTHRPKATVKPVTVAGFTGKTDDRPVYGAAVQRILDSLSLTPGLPATVVARPATKTSRRYVVRRAPIQSRPSHPINTPRVIVPTQSPPRVPMRLAGSTTVSAKLRDRHGDAVVLVVPVYSPARAGDPVATYGPLRPVRGKSYIRAVDSSSRAPNSVPAAPTLPPSASASEFPLIGSPQPDLPRPILLGRAGRPVGSVSRVLIQPSREPSLSIRNQVPFKPLPRPGRKDLARWLRAPRSSAPKFSVAPRATANQIRAAYDNANNKGRATIRGLTNPTLADISPYLPVVSPVPATKPSANPKRYEPASTTSPLALANASRRRRGKDVIARPPDDLFDGPPQLDLASAFWLPSSPSDRS